MDEREAAGRPHALTLTLTLTLTPTPTLTPNPAQVVEAMVAVQEAKGAGGRPIIFALSNPKTQAEITASNPHPNPNTNPHPKP